MQVSMYVYMYLHHHRGIIPPPSHGGGGGGVGTRDTGPYIYMGYDGLPVICIYISLSLNCNLISATV